MPALDPIAQPRLARPLARERMALLVALGSLAASNEVIALTAAVHDLLATAASAGTGQSTDALCRAVIAAAPQDANLPPLNGKADALAEHGLPSPDARWNDHVAAVLNAAGSSADHEVALRALEAHTHPMQKVPPLDSGSRLEALAPSLAPGSARRGELGSSPEASAGAGAGTKLGASRVLQKERQLRRRAEAARDAAEARERDLTRELQRERARRRRAEASAAGVEVA